MDSPTLFPPWAEELRRRYLRGEASLFILFGNVHDSVIHRGVLIGVSDFLAQVVLAKKKTVLRYNVSTGCRFVKKGKPAKGSVRGDVNVFEELLVQRTPARILPAIERLMLSHDNVAALIDYVEMVAPAGDAAFLSEQDRLAVVTLQRWSLSPQFESSDNIVILMTEAPIELHPKIVANPRVAAVQVPMPDRATRRRVVELVNPAIEDEWVDKLAEVTAGLKSVQIESILRPRPADEEDAETRFRFIKSLIGNDGRARKFAALTQGMARDEIQELIGVDAPSEPDEPDDQRFAEVLHLIGRRKREIIERECFGLIEFVDPDHDFSMVGGMDEIKEQLLQLARDIRAGRRSRVPMGMLFTGPMGTGKTFVAEAFVKESGLTGIKLKNFRSKWVGATESNLEKILDVVRAIGNTIVIIDEGDRSLGAGDGDGGTTSRVIARLKEFMSDTSNRGRVLFIIMTNRPDKLDIDIKRAGRLDRKIPFFYAQSAEQVEPVLEALFRKHCIDHNIEFSDHRKRLLHPIVGYSNADLEAIVLMAASYAANQAAELVSAETMMRAIADYLPSRNAEMLEYMELLAVFEASNRRMLPEKYASVSVEQLQARLGELELVIGGRR
ncbi:MAG: AAA family ATPase [Proteobacteria bacterium]|nr:AAA family ATPase [Pseudomonadota bacterium]